MNTALALIVKAEEAGWIEFRMADLVGAVCKTDSQDLHDLSRALREIEGMANERGLDMFSFRDERTRETVVRIETAEYRAQKRAELKARIEEMKRLRPVIGQELTP